MHFDTLHNIPTGVTPYELRTVIDVIYMVVDNITWFLFYKKNALLPRTIRITYTSPVQINIFISGRCKHRVVISEMLMIYVY